MKQPCVYIMASRRNGTLYTGVTSNLPKRAFEHREGLVAGFSKKHACKILVWYELHGSNRSPHERSDMRDRLPGYHCAHPGYGCVLAAVAEGFWIASLRSQ